MTPKISPTSPLPRLSHPSTAATLRPADFSTLGNHINEWIMSGISGNASFRCGQLFIRSCVHDGDTTRINGAVIVTWGWQFVRFAPIWQSWQARRCGRRYNSSARIFYLHPSASLPVLQSLLGTLLARFDRGPDHHHFVQDIEPK